MKPEDRRVRLTTKIAPETLTRLEGIAKRNGTGLGVAIDTVTKYWNLP